MLMAVVTQAAQGFGFQFEGTVIYSYVESYEPPKTCVSPHFLGHLVGSRPFVDHYKLWPWTILCGMNHPVRSTNNR